MEDRCNEIVFDKSTDWEIWHRDTFDRETPATMEIKGNNIEQGLKELWKRILLEGTAFDGQKSFSDFMLQWKNGENSGCINFAAGSRHEKLEVEIAKLKFWWCLIGDLLVKKIVKRHLKVIEETDLESYDYKTSLEVLRGVKSVRTVFTL